MRIWCRKNNSTLKAKITINEEHIVSINITEPKEDSDEYIAVGEHALKLEGHNTYSVLWSKEGYLIRNLENEQYRSKIKIVPTNQITMGSRMKFEEVENRYGGMVLMQFDTNTISLDVLELQMQFFRLQKDNVELDLLPGMEPEYVTLNINDVFKNGTKRFSLWDTYSLIINGEEYKSGRRSITTVSIPTDDKEYVEIGIQKYSNCFGKKLEREADNEYVFIECTGGITNCQRVKLTNGKASFRWYPLGFKGEFKIKLGWRWFSGIIDLAFIAE